MSNQQLPGYLPPNVTAPPAIGAKLFSECPRLDVFHVFYEYDSNDDDEEIEFSAEGLPLYEAELVQVVGLWEPDAGNTPDDIPEFVAAGVMLLDQAGSEWADSDDTYIYGTVLVRGEWRRMFITTVSLLDTQH